LPVLEREDDCLLVVLPEYRALFWFGFTFEFREVAGFDFCAKLRVLFNWRLTGVFRFLSLFFDVLVFLTALFVFLLRSGSLVSVVR
jgi:hypothetical protein